MISVYKIKPWFQKTLQPLLLLLRKTGVTPNHLTVSAMLFSVGLAVMLLFCEDYPLVLLFLPLGLLIRMALNALDGMMARQFKMQSRSGEVLNEMGDIISDVVIILSLSPIPGLDRNLIFLFALLSVINEFSGVLGRATGGERRYEGPMGKSDRALLIGLYCIVFYFWRGVAEYSAWIFAVACILLIISTLTRVIKIVK